MIPGSNLLGAALSVIGRQVAAWHATTGRTANDLGQWVTQYAAPVTIYGSLQPLDARRYAELGLEAARKYWSFYTGAGVVPVGRDTAGDLLDIGGRRYQVIDSADGDWQAVDGWRELVIVDVGPTP